MPHNLTAEQLRAMFSKEEISRGISSKDIAMRKKEFGISDERPIQPREEFRRRDVIEIPKQQEKKIIPQEIRDIMLPSRFKIIKTGEKKGQEVRKKKFGPEDPTAEATEAQKEALVKMTGRSQTQTTAAEAFREFQRAKQQRMMEVIVGLEGGRITDPVAQAAVLRLSPAERLEAREQLQRIASRKGKASPLELSASDVDFILRRVKPR